MYTMSTNLKWRFILGKATYAKHAMKHAHKLPRPAKKTIIWVVAIIGVIGLVLVGLIIALIVWLVSVITSSDTATQVIDTAQQTTTQVVQDNLQGVQTDPLAYIENGQVNTTALEEQVKALSPDQLILFTQQFTDQVNQLLESGQIVQEQANQFLQIIP